jgi:hypothetical protein
MPGDFTGRTWGHLDTATRSEQEKAARFIASKADGVGEATELLAMLGLLPPGHPATIRSVDHGMPGYKQGCRCTQCTRANRQRLARQRRTA